MSIIRSGVSVGPTDFCRSAGSLWTLAEKGGEAKEEGRNCPIQSGGLSLFFLTPLETSLGDERRYFPTDLAGFFKLLLFGENYVCGDCLSPPYIVCSRGMTSNVLRGKGAFLGHGPKAPDCRQHDSFLQSIFLDLNHRTTFFRNWKTLHPKSINLC